jgi:isocitrate dehydrogenase (NAD+)
LLQTAIMMLRHLGEREAADLIERAMIHTLAVKQVRTRDLGGTASTTEYTESIVASMRELASA